MDSEKRKSVATISTKLPAELLDELGKRAFYRRVTRSWLLRELVEAFCDGRVHMTPPRRSRGMTGMTIAELGASDVGQAALRDAHHAVEAALDPDTAARREASRLAEGR